jgi:hypothetical protein
MLKAEIARLYEERKETKRSKTIEEKVVGNLESKYTFAKEMLDKHKEEKMELKKENFNLQKKVLHLSKKYTELKAQYHRWAESSAKIAEFKFVLCPFTRGWLDADAKAIDRNQTQQAMSEPFFNGQLPKMSVITPSAMVTPSDYEVLDFPTVKLRLKTLTHEKGFFSNENKMLKNKLDEMQSRQSLMEKKVFDLSNRNRQMEKEWQTHNDQVRELSIMCVHAQKLASSLEKQYKDAVPNVRIDYSYVKEMEPSTQLLAALTPKFVEADAMKGELAEVRLTKKASGLSFFNLFTDNDRLTYTNLALPRLQASV